MAINFHVNTCRSNLFRVKQNGINRKLDLLAVIILLSEKYFSIVISACYM